MKIVADADLYRIAELFGNLGELVLVPGRELSHQDLAEADALLVRSVSQVNEELLANSPLKFVGTATSGTDHVDIQYLQNQGIYFCDAKGSNANAVVDYCFAALNELDYLQPQSFSDLSIGVIGYGAIGKKLTEKLRALGANVILNDPPLQELNNTGIDFSGLEELTQCDIVSVHTPLTDNGKYPTRNLIDANFLQQMKERVLLINACRGGVVNERDVLEVAMRNESLQLVFDVWENEPFVSKELVARANIATPHIAGYSQESKFEAVNCLKKALAEFFELEIEENLQAEDSPRPVSIQSNQIGLLSSLLQQGFSIAELNTEFKQAVAKGNGETFFDQARKQLLSRREYKSFFLSNEISDGFERAVLKQLGAQEGS